jgi:hypothetical protein
VCKHVVERLTTYPIFIEGSQRITQSDNATQFELRIDGPTFTIPSKGCYRGRVEVNILCISVMKDNDFHEIHRMVGQAAEVLAQAICVYRLGDGPNDDQSFLGRLTLLQGEGDKLEANHLGQIDRKTKIVQAMVESHYRLELVN